LVRSKNRNTREAANAASENMKITLPLSFFIDFGNTASSIMMSSDEAAIITIGIEFEKSV
jgi:hypothetical protein